MILFVHGWGYDAGFWDPLRGEIGDLASAALDLGFFGSLDEAIPDGVTMLVGHSLGFLWLARQPALTHLPLIGINAFPRFLESDEYRPAIGLRVLERMRRRLLADAGDMLGEFWARAGTRGPDKTADTSALANGLDRLATWDERANLAARASPVHLIAGGQDAIVPADMTRMAFEHSVIFWLPEGGHALPRTHPTDLAALMRAFAQVWRR
ncbi:MAG: alpha/beta fold hydrolase [Dongiaceae bacterium]